MCKHAATEMGHKNGFWQHLSVSVNEACSVFLICCKKALFLSCRPSRLSGVSEAQIYIHHHYIYGLTVYCNKGVFHTHFNKSMRNRIEQHKWSHRFATSGTQWLCVKCSQARWRQRRGAAAGTSERGHGVLRAAWPLGWMESWWGPRKNCASRVLRAEFQGRLELPFKAAQVCFGGVQSSWTVSGRTVRVAWEFK